MKILIAGLILGLTFHAHAGEDRGGGGGFCVYEKCITVAEAGFRFQTKTASKISEVDLTIPISVELDAEIRRIESLLPGDAEYNVSNVSLSTYMRVSSYNAKKFQIYKKVYLDLFKKSGISSKGFELLAVSDVKEQKTYLLPEFYRAGLRTQALTLFHESAIREGFNVKEALILDGMILDYLSGKIDASTLILERSKYKSAGERFSILANIYADQGHYVELNELNNLPLDFDMSDVQSISKMSQAYPTVWRFMLEVGGLRCVREIPTSTRGREGENYDRNILDLDKRCAPISGNKKFIVNSIGMVVSVSCSSGKVTSYTPMLVY